MGRSEYPTLDIVLDTPRSRLFSGAVRNVYDWGKSIYSKYLGKHADAAYAEDSPGNGGKTLGMHVHMDDGYNSDHYVGWEEQDDPLDTFYVRAHEETHALHAQGGLGELEKRLRQYGVELDLKALRDYRKTDSQEREYVAHLGALYALDRKGIDVAQYAKSKPHLRSSPQMEEALAAYTEARKPATPSLESKIAPSSAAAPYAGALRRPGSLAPAYAAGLAPRASQMTFYERLLREAYEAIERLMELLRTYAGPDKERYKGMMPAYATASAIPGYSRSSYDALR